MMNARTVLSRALLLALSISILAACGGGGGMVRVVSAAADPPVPPPPPPPPPLPQTGPCPSPVTSDCVIDVPGSTAYQQMTGGRQSDYALVKRGDGYLDLGDVPGRVDGNPGGTFRFGGGVTVESGELRVWEASTLQSNVVVQTTGSLGVLGVLEGNVTNHGSMGLSGKMIGNVVNDGVLGPNSLYGGLAPARVVGNFSQTENGTLMAMIGQGARFGMTTDGGFLSVSGRADIDGTLQLVHNTYEGWDGPFPLPAAPFTTQVLHADGGVFGQFAQWTSPGLFITGSIRYLPNDVYFDATAISAAKVMGSAGARALTVQSAARFDAALDNAATSAATPDPSRNNARQQFLASAAAIQRLQDYDRAIRTFDSLSGSGHTSAIDALLLQSSMPDASLMSRMDNLRPGSKLGAWSGRSSALASSNGAFNGARAGFDQWLGDRLVLGANLGTNEGSLRFGRMGGTARDRSPQWDVYAQQLVGDDAYVFGNVGYGHHQLDTRRAIDLGIGQFAVTGLRDLDLLQTHVESGQHFRIGNGRLTLFGALSHVTLHGAGFVEQGVTGLELVAQPSTHERTSATSGVRFGQAWRNGGRVTALNLAAGYSQTLHARDDARAAFIGAPDATFALDALPAARSSSWLQLSLGTGNERWNLGVNYERLARNQSLLLHTRLAF